MCLQVALAALEVTNALVSNDVRILEASCLLGLVPQSSSSSAPEINSSVRYPNLLVLTQRKDQSRHQPLTP